MIKISTRKFILFILGVVLVVGVGGYLLAQMLLPEVDMEHQNNPMVMEMPEGEGNGSKPAPNRFSSMGTIHGGEMQYGIFTPDTYLWDFGDGATSIEKDPSHQYVAAGSYTVTLTITSTEGNEYMNTTEITVEAPE